MSEQHPLRIAGTSRDPEPGPGSGPIDIDGLTEPELIDLNRRIVERLRVLQQLRAHRNMLQFSVGQRVRFRANARTVEGTLTRYNRKTVTVITEAGEHWNVAPSLLEPVT
jgi:hypothetical protein